MIQRPSVDIVVYGASLVGCAVAREAALAGAKVKLIDPGVGVCSAPEPGALLTQAVADTPSPLFGLKRAGLQRMDRWLDAVTGASGVHVPVMRAGTLAPVTELHALKALHQRAAWQRDAGLPFQAMTAGDAREKEPGLPEDTAAALYLPEDISVDVASLRRALLRAAVEAGVDIYLGTPALGLLERPGGIAGVRVPEGPVEGAVTVLCADIGAGAGALPITRRRQPCLSLEQGQWPRHTLWSPEGYICPSADGRVTLVGQIGRAGLDPRLTVEETVGLLTMATTLMPALEELPVGPSGAIMREISADGLPVLGPDEAVSLLQARGLGADEVVLAPVIAALVVEYLQTGQATTSDWSPFSPLRLRG